MYTHTEDDFDFKANRKGAIRSEMGKIIKKKDLYL